MQTPKQFAFVSFILFFVATGCGLLVWGLRTRGAGPEQGNRPRALLQVAAHAPKVLFSTTGDDSDAYNRYLQTQFVLIKSRSVINAALQQPTVSQLSAVRNQADPVAWLQQNLETINIKDSEVVQVSLSPTSGANGKDQSAIVNAVVHAYMDEVVGMDAKRRADRHTQLRKLQDKYWEMIKDRRQTVRLLSETVGSKPLSSFEQNSLERRYDGLLDQRLKLRLDRAETETLLERRRNAANRETEPVRKEIAQFEDRLAVLTAHERVLEDEPKQVAGEKRSLAMRTLDLKAQNDEIAQMEDAARKVGAEVEALNVELDAPPRVRIIEDAVPPTQ